MRKKLAFVAVMISTGSLATAAWAQGTQEPTTPGEPMQAPKGEAPKQEAKEPKLTASEKRFVEDTFRDSLAEVELAKVAVGKTSSPAVKKLADMTESDHQKANEGLKVIAEKRGITVPEGITKEQKNLREKLENTTAERFDSKYVSDSIAEHKKEIARFEKEIPNIKDPELKAWATSTLEKLRDHLKMAESVQNELNQAKPQQGEMQHEQP